MSNVGSNNDNSSSSSDDESSEDDSDGIMFLFLLFDNLFFLFIFLNFVCCNKTYLASQDAAPVDYSTSTKDELIVLLQSKDTAV
jgi:hypothetical protein